MIRTVVPAFFYGVRRVMIANKKDNSFSKLSHKCTSYEDCTSKIKYERGEHMKELVTLPMILKAPFQVLPGSMTWELQAFQSESAKINRLLKCNKKFQKQFYFILSIEVTSLILTKKDVNGRVFVCDDDDDLGEGSKRKWGEDDDEDSDDGLQEL